MTQATSYTRENLTGISATRGSNIYTNFGYSYVNSVTSKATNLVYQMTDASNNTWKYTWDVRNNFTSATETNGGNAVSSYQYGYDQANDRTSQTLTYGTDTAQPTNFTFNAAELVATARGTINKNYIYDNNGQWTSATDTGNPATTLLTLQYNPEGQMTSTTLAGETQGTGVTYTPIGQQSQTTNPTDTYSYGTSAGGTEHIGHTNTQTQASISDNSLTTLPDGSILSETITQNGSTNTYYPLTDANGSAVGLTYTDSGKVTHMVVSCPGDVQGQAMNGASPCAAQTVENLFGYGGMQ